jgi:hypothetical protein
MVAACDPYSCSLLPLQLQPPSDPSGRRLMRLADRLAAAAEQSDLKQVGSSLAQVQQRLIHIMNYSVRGMLVHNTLTELAEDLRLAAAAEEPQTACLQLQKAADEFRQLSEYLSIKRPSPRPSVVNSAREAASTTPMPISGGQGGFKPRAGEGPSAARRREARETRETAHTPSLEEEGREAGRELMAREASARHQLTSSEAAVSRSEVGKAEEASFNLASSHEELQCKTTVAAAVLTGQGMLEAMRRAVRQSHSLHHSAACRLVVSIAIVSIAIVSLAIVSLTIVTVSTRSTPPRAGAWPKPPSIRYDSTYYGYTCHGCSLPHLRLQARGRHLPRGGRRPQLGGDGRRDGRGAAASGPRQLSLLPRVRPHRAQRHGRRRQQRLRRRRRAVAAPGAVAVAPRAAPGVARPPVAPAVGWLGRARALPHRHQPHRGAAGGGRREKARHRPQGGARAVWRRRGLLSTDVRPVMALLLTMAVLPVA